MIGSTRDNAVFTSTNGGATWQVVTPEVDGSDYSSWSAMSFIDVNTGWIVGNITGEKYGDYYVLKTPATAETPMPEEQPDEEPFAE
jgi:hypothetical protein